MVLGQNFSRPFAAMDCPAFHAPAILKNIKIKKYSGGNK